MAEIHIEKKQGMGMMVWLIPALLVLGLLWWLFARGDNNAVGVVGTDSAVMATETAAGDIAYRSRGSAGAVDEFVRFVAVTDANRDATQQHGFAAGGIRRLAAALEGMNPTSGATAGLAEMRRQADALESSPPESDRHAAMTRTAFLAAADVFGVLPGSPNVRTEAEGVQAGSPLLGQRDKVDAFFNAASRALQGARRGS